MKELIVIICRVIGIEDLDDHNKLDEELSTLDKGDGPNKENFLAFKLIDNVEPYFLYKKLENGYVFVISKEVRSIVEEDKRMHGIIFIPTKGKIEWIGKLLSTN